MSRIPPTPPSSPHPLCDLLRPSRSRVTSTVVPPTSGSTPSVSPSVRTGRRRFPSFPSSTTMLSSASPGARCGRSSMKWDVYANYAYLDTHEREMFASQPQNMLITQVQKAIASGSKIQELNFNHPVKYLAVREVVAPSPFSTNDNKLKLQINGTDVADFKFADPNFTTYPSTTTRRTPPASAQDTLRLPILPRHW